MRDQSISLASINSIQTKAGAQAAFHALNLPSTRSVFVQNFPASKVRMKNTL